jgi:hypothetical protein
MSSINTPNYKTKLGACISAYNVITFILMYKNHVTDSINKINPRNNPRVLNENDSQRRVRMILRMIRIRF